MNNISTISWWTFFICGAVLILIWILSTKTRIGRKIILRETPWNISQWTRFLLAIGITLFILIDPVFHVLTIGIFGSLYYVFVTRNILFKNLQKLNKGESLRGSIPFISGESNLIKLNCRYEKESNLLESRTALNKCLFSFPMIEEGTIPKVDQLNNTYVLELRLVSKDYTSSFVDYIKKSGFEVEVNNK